MNTIQLRSKIIERLHTIDDETFLKALDLLTKNKSNESVYHLSAEQKLRVTKARQDLASGRTISHETLEAEIEKWLDSK